MGDLGSVQKELESRGYPCLLVQFVHRPMQQYMQDIKSEADVAAFTTMLEAFENDPDCQVRLRDDWSQPFDVSVIGMWDQRHRYDHGRLIECEPCSCRAMRRAGDFPQRSRPTLSGVRLSCERGAGSL